MANNLPTIGIIGGTGALGGALAKRWAKTGYDIIVGSRDAAKARSAVDRLGTGRAIGSARGLTNAAAADAAGIVVIAVPFASHQGIVEEIHAGVQGKIVVDTTVPLVPPKVARVQLPATGSVAVATQMFFGKDVRLVSAFQNVAAHKLASEFEVDCDVLVCGDDKAARGEVIRLAEAAGLRGIHAGPLDNAVVAEALTSILIGINRNYKVDGAGIRITGDLISGD